MENPVVFEGFHGKFRSFWMVSEVKIIYKQAIFHGYGKSPDGNGIFTTIQTWPYIDSNGHPYME